MLRPIREVRLLAPRRALALVALLALPPALGAQTAADAALCERVVDARNAEARARLQQLAAGATPPALFAQGCLALADDRNDEAAQRFGRVVAASEGNATAHFWLGRAYGEQAQRANVLRQASLARRTKSAFDRAVQLDPDHLDAREGLLQFYLLAPGILGGSEARAREQAQEIRRRNPYRGAFAASTIAVRRKDWAGAARELESAVAQYPDSAAVWSQLAAMYGQQKDWTRAFATIDRMQQAKPDAPVAWYALGRLAAESGEQLDRGAAALRRYVAAGRPKPGDPPLANAHWRLGAILERQGQREQARAEYQAAVRLDPQLKPAREALDRLR